MGDSAGVFVRVPVHSVTRDGSRSALLSRCHLTSEIQTSGLRLFAVTERLEKLSQLTEVISGMPLLSPKITPSPCWMPQSLSGLTAGSAEDADGCDKEQGSFPRSACACRAS